MAEPGGKGEGKLQLIGDVAGREAVVCDHLIDSARTLEQRVKLLKRAGAGRCVAVATHGIFSGRALQRISRSQLSDCIITNTVPLREDVDVRDIHKLSQLSVAPLLASAIIRAQCDLSFQPAQPGISTASARYAGQGE
jgi:ribose-phosphate pyrophosphokinase